jgi:hypothetical protein
MCTSDMGVSVCDLGEQGIEIGLERSSIIEGVVYYDGLF